MSSSPSVTSRLQGGPERRRNIRCRVLERQLVTVGLGPDRRGLLVDISESGAAVQPYTELHTGDTSPVCFQLPGSTATIEAQGVVSWVGPTGRVGIRFVAVPEESQDYLRRWIDGLAPAAAPATSPGATLATAAYLPPSYSPWVRMSDLNLEPSRLGDNIGDLDLVSALRLVVERSRAVTRASGAAVALADKEEMVCRARTGVAPDLGARFRPDSGLSGEAVRTAKTVRCTDASQDLRVDRVACERLNVRSIVITPVLSSAAVIGVIEVFSPRAQAFDERDELHLRRMADLVAAMLENSIDHLETGFLPELDAELNTAHLIPVLVEPTQRFEIAETAAVADFASEPVNPEAAEALPDDGVNTNTPASSAAPGAASPQTAVSEPPADSAKLDAGVPHPSPLGEGALTLPSPEQIQDIYRGFMQQASEEDRHKRNKTIGIVLLSLALLACALTVPYWLLRKKAAPAPQRLVPATSVTQPETFDIPAVLPATTRQTPQATKPTPTSGDGQNRTKARGERWSWMAPTKPGTGSELKLESPQPTAPESAPEMTSTPGQVKVINDMVASWGEADASSADSHIVEGKLINRVDPIFPPHVNHAAARGRVVVRIAIDKNGRVQRTEPVNGDPILTSAAVQAIRQWRYEPYQVDGQPIAVEKTITIDFSSQR